MIIIDIDYFKRVNDTYGHLVGNGVLSTFSQMLLKISFPPNTVISRIGGEEFAIILPNINVSETEHLAEKIRRKVEKLMFRLSLPAPLLLFLLALQITMVEIIQARTSY